ncbi:hypothetical protein [Eoetvoesiella caeni]
MKVSELLTRALNCHNQTDVYHLHTLFRQLFATSAPLSHLSPANDETCLEDDNQPFIRFELNREISGDYVTMIRPEIRDKKLVIVVATDRTDDGLGLCSESYTTIDDMDEVIYTEPHETVFQLTKQAAELAITQHRKLIESVGVPIELAAKTARKCWKSTF